MPLTPTQSLALARIAEASITSELRTSIPAELTCAQCILESAWLKVAPGNNCLGIKDYAGSAGRQLLLTREWFTDKELAWFLHLGDQRSATPVDPPDTAPRPDGRRQYRVYDWFATFPTLADCFARRAVLFLHPPYATALATYQQDHNLLAYVIAIARTYATSPNYASVLMSIIRMTEVVDALDIARQQVGNPNPVTGSTSEIPT